MLMIHQGRLFKYKRVRPRQSSSRMNVINVDDELWFQSVSQLISQQ